MNEEQMNNRRWIASIDQTCRRFGHHCPEQEPEVPTKQIADGVMDAELEAELERLEGELDVS